jgi:hypothetical protein
MRIDPFFVVAMFGVLVACGGSTRAQPDADGGVPTTSGPSTSGSGGSTGSSTGTGAGGGVAGSGTGGGGSPELCRLPMVVGPCEAAIQRFWHDPATGVCVPFVYGGCEGNANNFDSLEACQAACKGSQPDMAACSGPGECTLLGAGCCAPCDQATARSFVAVNVARAQEYTHVKGCDTVSCGACPPFSEPESTRQYFVATCREGACVVTDVRETDLTKCSTSGDCVLRDGAECCEHCDGQGIVALNRAARLDDLVCAMPRPSCPPCVPIIPMNLVPLCTSNRCSVGFLR